MPSPSSGDSPLLFANPHASDHSTCCVTKVPRRPRLWSVSNRGRRVRWWWWWRASRYGRRREDRVKYNQVKYFHFASSLKYTAQARRLKTYPPPRFVKRPTPPPEGRSRLARPRCRCCGCGSMHGRRRRRRGPQRPRRGAAVPAAAAAGRLTRTAEAVDATASHAAQSLRSAAIGSSCAACRAGYTPKARPTTVHASTAPSTGSGAQATCQPASAAMV